VLSGKTISPIALRLSKGDRRDRLLTRRAPLVFHDSVFPDTVFPDDDNVVYFA
jgi:hypothetical protein